jgi:hypothetical protein
VPLHFCQIARAGTGAADLVRRGEFAAGTAFFIRIITNRTARELASRSITAGITPTSLRTTAVAFLTTFNDSITTLAARYSDDTAVIDQATRIDTVAT